MKDNTKTSKAASIYSDILSAFIFTFAVISLAVMITLNFKPLYYHDIEALNIPQASGLTEEKIKENYNKLIDYNNFWGSKELEFTGLKMSEEGKIHFEEVKAIFVKLEYAAMLFSLMFIVSIAPKIKAKRYRCLKLSSIFAVAVPVIVGLLVAINWEWAFTAFHKIAFRNDYWIFDPSEDQVITMLPDGFFLHCAVMIIAITMFLTALSAAAYILLSRRNKNVGKG